MRHLSDIVLNQNSLMLPSTELVADACRQMSESHVDSVLIVDEQKGLLKASSPTTTLFVE